MPTDQPVILNRDGAIPVAISNPNDRPVVSIVDDDAEVREALTELMSSAGLQARCFASPRDYLSSDAPEKPGCLVLDVRMPGSSGLDLQLQLAKRGDVKPIVFITGHGDIPMTVQAMKAGAIDFLTKPFRDQTLLDAVIAGIERDAVLRGEMLAICRNVGRFETLTRRERQVMREVARGCVNKQIAHELGISEVTVKLHRANLMRKLEIGSVGELIRLWEALPQTIKDRPPSSSS